MKTLDSKFGFIKHFALGMFFLLGCYLTAFADPFSGTAFLISLAVSAAVTAATAGLTYLLTPRPKPIDKNKLQGEIQISSIGEDISINEIYGARGSDGKGGIKTGVNFIYISDIRGAIETKSSSSGGGKGGKQPTTKEHHYYVDLAAMVALNRTRILEIRAGTDVLYRNYPKPTAAQGTHYQCESGTLGGGATVESNVLFASGQAVKLPSNNGTITKSITGDGENHAFYFQYLTATDKSIDITINGEAHTIALPPTYGRVESVMIIGSTNVGSTTVYIHTPVNDNDSLWLDEIIVGENFVEQTEVTRFSGISGVKNENYVNPSPTYDYLTLQDPLSDDFRGADEYNYQANHDSYNSTEVGLPSGCSLRIYEGTADQLPDPMLQAYFETKYGADSTPAYRHRSYFVLENFEITQYGQIPNFTVISESVEFQTLGAMYAHRAQRAGLDSSEFDFSDFDNIPIRGFAINQRQAPRTEMEILNRIFDIDVYENSDGKIIGVVPTEDVLVQIPADDLDAEEKSVGDNDENKKLTGLKSVIRNEYELPKRLDFSYFDSTKDFEVGNSYASREVTVSEKRENIETSLVLTQDEAQKIADRMFQQMWAEKDAEEFSTFYKYSWLNPTDLIEVVSHEGAVNRIRLKQKNGNMPGKLDFVGVSRQIAYPAPRIFLEPSNRALSYPWLNVPAHVIGTLMDFPLRTTETQKGLYAACVMTDQAYSFKGSALAWEREAGWETLQTFNAQATMGRTVTGSSGILGDVPGGWTADSWDDDSEVTFDLFFGEVETRTEAEVLDRFNTLVIGNEVISFANATRVNGYPNRWTVSRLRRRLRNTIASGHAANDRVVLLNDAVKFIPYDVSEAGVTRDYAFISSGQSIESASKFSFTWNGLSSVIIEKNGVATLDTVKIAVKNVSTLFRFRKIRVSANSDMSGFSDLPIIDLAAKNKASEDIELITRTYSDTPETKYVEVFHSVDGIDFGFKSNKLTILFENELNNGVPSVSGDAEIEPIGENWLIRVPLPTANGFNLKRLRFRFLNEATFSTAAIDQSSSVTSIQLVDASGFNSSGGRAFIDRTKETFRYEGVSGNTLTGVTRGIENSSAAAILEDDEIYDVLKQEEILPQTVFNYPRLQPDTIFHYQWGNDYYATGKNGLSEWRFGAFAPGIVSTPTPAPYEPVPPPPYEPPIEGEDPFDPTNDKRSREIGFYLSD